MSERGTSPLRLGRTFECIVFEWDGVVARDSNASAASVRHRVESLSRAGVHVAVVSDADVAIMDGRLRARPEGPGRLWLSLNRGSELFEVAPDGPRLVSRQAPSRDRSDAIRTILTQLHGLGIGPGLVLIAGADFGQVNSRPGRDAAMMVPEARRCTFVSVGPEPGLLPSGVWHVAGGSRRFLSVLDDQLRRRARRRVPSVDEDPAWVVRERAPDPRHRGADDARFTLGDGAFASRGAVEESPGTDPVVLATGVYTGHGSGQHLLPASNWTRLGLGPAPIRNRRILDLRTGVLYRQEIGHGPPFRSLRFVSACDPGVMAMRAEGRADTLYAGRALARTAEGRWRSGHQDGMSWAEVDSDLGGGVVAAAIQRTRRDGDIRTVERLVAYTGDPRRTPSLTAAAGALRSADGAGFDALLSRHRTAWAARWDVADVSIPDDPETQLAVRFALFHLWVNAAGLAEGAVGARGLSGPGYSGHVFWDADVFVLPAIASLEPAAARAMLGYRLTRLRAALKATAEAGYRGARFPWESAAAGTDVTPTTGWLGDVVVPIRTGRLEEHVTADVAWAAVRYATWTGDLRHFRARLIPLVLQTARYWASRCRRDRAGRWHIDDVIGPDEYHESVDDNAFTNVMARWNLRRAAELARNEPRLADESRSWLEIAAGLVDGYDAHTGLYEQFAGYHDLERLRVADFSRAPVAADVVLGPGRVAGSQIIKQPDVLMLHHLVPDEVAAGSLGPNIDFYGPRTAHGSSLSPAVMALLLAKVGRPDESLEALGLARAIDLDDLTGTTDEGLHLATMGGLWQAVLNGYAGVGADGHTMTVDPHLPSAWGTLGVRFRCLGRRVRLELSAGWAEIEVDGPLPVRTGVGPVRHLSPGRHRLRLPETS